MSALIKTISADELEDSRSRDNPALRPIWALLEAVKDPEIPVLSIADLGILRAVHREDDALRIVITPTYSGCPAMRTIEEDVRELLKSNGYNDVRVETRLTPPWTTAWMNEDARERLRAYGVAAPVDGEDPQPACPLCGSSNTKQISEFGSTSCKALHQCTDCLEPFDYFKQI